MAHVVTAAALLVPFPATALVIAAVVDPGPRLGPGDHPDLPSRE